MTRKALVTAMAKKKPTRKKTTANSGRTVAKKPPTTGQWKKGQSGNPAGAPKRGQSWKELIAEIGDMTGQEVAASANFLPAQFKDMPPNVTLKELVVLRVFASLINEPTPGLLTALMERVEGKVAQAVEVSGKNGEPISIIQILPPPPGDSGAGDDAE